MPGTEEVGEFSEVLLRIPCHRPVTPVRGNPSSP